MRCVSSRAARNTSNANAGCCAPSAQSRYVFCPPSSILLAVLSGSARKESSREQRHAQRSVWDSRLLIARVHARSRTGFVRLTGHTPRCVSAGSTLQRAPRFDKRSSGNAILTFARAKVATTDGRTSDCKPSLSSWDCTSTLALDQHRVSAVLTDLSRFVQTHLTISAARLVGRHTTSLVAARTDTLSASTSIWSPQVRCAHRNCSPSAIADGPSYFCCRSGTPLHCCSPAGQ